MKLYVDSELHNDCVSCSNLYLNNADTYSCKLLREVVGATIYDCAGQRHKDCPYKSLSDYTKQVRKELCEKIYKALTSDDGWRIMKGWCNFNGTCESMRIFLDEIQGEDK